LDSVASLTYQPLLQGEKTDKKTEIIRCRK